MKPLDFIGYKFQSPSYARGQKIIFAWEWKFLFTQTLSFLIKSLL